MQLLFWALVFAGMTGWCVGVFVMVVDGDLYFIVFRLVFLFVSMDWFS